VIADHSHVNITHTRNNLIRKFLNESGVEWLLMLDTDMVVPPNLIDTLLASAVSDPESDDYTPFIGGLCFTIDGNGDVYPTMYNWTEPGSEKAVEAIHSYDYGKMIEVGATGAACLLMHKDALLKIHEQNHDDIFPWFKEYQYEDIALSEDFGLMRRIADCGFKVRVNTAAKLGHFKPFVIDETMYKFQNPAAK
jgi:GT2 family glycosyltransferase